MNHAQEFYTFDREWEAEKQQCQSAPEALQDKTDAKSDKTGVAS